MEKIYLDSNGSLNTGTGASARGFGARTRARAAENRLCLRRPGRRRGLDLRPRQRPQGAGKRIRRQDQDLVCRERA